MLLHLPFVIAAYSARSHEEFATGDTGLRENIVIGTALVGRSGSHKALDFLVLDFFPLPILLEQLIQLLHFKLRTCHRLGPGTNASLDAW